MRRDKTGNIIEDLVLDLGIMMYASPILLSYYVHPAIIYYY